eukprot:9494195-Pyramimonas_sp.AAC.1
MSRLPPRRDAALDRLPHGGIRGAGRRLHGRVLRLPAAADLGVGGRLGQGSELPDPGAVWRRRRRRRRIQGRGG